MSSYTSSGATLHTRTKNLEYGSEYTRPRSGEYKIGLAIRRSACISGKGVGGFLVVTDPYLLEIFRYENL